MSLDKITEIFVFILGLIAGSFLNVCIHRMPEEGYSLVRPSSHCPACKKPILWYDNIPILSFLLLAGRCRFCKGKISLRYPIVELLTAAVFLVMYRRYGPSWDCLAYAVFACGLIIATFIDIRWRIIPDEISLGGIAAGLFFALIKSLPNLRQFPRIPIVDSLIGVLTGGFLIYLSGLLGNLIFFKLMKKESIEGETESMGGGDVKFLAMIGAFLGLRQAVMTFFLAPFVAIFFGIYVMIYKKSHLIPYGPFLAIAAVLSLFFGQTIIRFLFRF